jgi:hypothetical protein
MHLNRRTNELEGRFFVQEPYLLLFGGHLCAISGDN